MTTNDNAFYISIYLFIGCLHLFAFWIKDDESIQAQEAIVIIWVWPFFWGLLLSPDWGRLKRDWRLGIKIFLALNAVLLLAYFIVSSI